MRLLLLFFLCLFLVLPGQAQERVRNVRIYVVDSVQLEIRYDLINARAGDSVYFEIRSRLRGPLRILPEFVRGDVGTQITAGSDRRIIWDALANGYSLNEEVQAKVLVKTSIPLVASQPTTLPEPVAVQKPVVTTSKPEPVPPKPTAKESVVREEPVSKTSTSSRNRTTRPKPSIFAADSVPSQPVTPTPVVAVPPSQPPASVGVSTPVPQQPASQTTAVVQSVEPAPTAAVADTVRPKRMRYAGPAWALLSAVAPGIGNIFVQLPKPKIGLRPLLTVGCYGLIAYGLAERKKSQDAFAIYEDQKNATAGEPYYQTANDHHHRYFMATRGAVVVAAADVILTFIKGLRNTQIQKEARRIDGVSLRPGLQAGQMTAVVRYSF
ncbi:hypothetical protein GCM10028808_58820 [Spirosoma migulaei]